MVGEGLVKNSAQLQALRFLMGMFESGFVPGCAYLISSYYTQNEFLLRYCLFFSMAILAGAFNGVSKSKTEHHASPDMCAIASCDCILHDEGIGRLLWYVFAPFDARTSLMVSKAGAGSLYWKVY